MKDLGTTAGGEKYSFSVEGSSPLFLEGKQNFRMFVVTWLSHSFQKEAPSGKCLYCDNRMTAILSLRFARFTFVPPEFQNQSCAL